VREERGAAQVFFSFLPGQTVDLGGRVWRVKEWVEARELPVDQRALRSAIASVSRAWEGLDDGFNRMLADGRELDVRQVDEHRGVLVEPFPELYRCKRCGLVDDRDDRPCRCGGRDRAQLHFVAYHECGRLEPPRIPRCNVHGISAMRLPGTTRTTEITFSCPTCARQIAQGFLSITCECGTTGKETDNLSLNVHRAGVVYTPRFATLVNSPDPSTNARLRASGGDTRALDWFVDGMPTPEPEEAVRTQSSLAERLRAMDLPPELAEQLAATAAMEGAVEATSKDEPAAATVDPIRQQAAEQALSLASAIASASGVAGGRRVLLGELDAGNSAALAYRYGTTYPEALERSRLADVTLLEEFPVVNVAFGYTRGSPMPGKSRLRSYRALGQPRCYGMLSRTEALLFQLDPEELLRWLRERGYEVPHVADARSARKALVGLAAVPGPHEPQEGLGGTLVEAVHSYAHRVVRSLSTFAGTDRDALAEYLLPNLGAFVVYGTGSGTFDLGGLRSVFESTLDEFLRSLVAEDPRCPLDPGCSHGPAACMACLHLGERSCQRFNVGLSRHSLYGPEGYLRA
jgi:hypothetical protein